MNRLAIFCKSYRPDLLRACRLARSVALYNRDGIPFYLSVPMADLDLFARNLEDIPCRLLTDEEIVSGIEKIYGPPPASFPEHLRQQLIKLEFWRLGLATNYLWIDSDSYFIRPFGEQDFMQGEIPLIVMHDGGDLFEFMGRQGKPNVLTDFQKTVGKTRDFFGRIGPVYDFGPSPVLWATPVLQTLAEDFLRPRGMTIYQLLAEYPGEITLYGEFLLYAKTIPVLPTGPFFKVFHYPEQFFAAQEQGEWDVSLAERYLGVVIQSNWARLPTLGERGWFRRLAKLHAWREKYFSGHHEKI